VERIELPVDAREEEEEDPLLLLLLFFLPGDAVEALLWPPPLSPKLLLTVELIKPAKESMGISPAVVWPVPSSPLCSSSKLSRRCLRCLTFDDFLRLGVWLLDFLRLFFLGEPLDDLRSLFFATMSLSVPFNVARRAAVSDSNSTYSSPHPLFFFLDLDRDI
jgi:hypothetical protein